MATISANLKMTLPESFDKVDVNVISDNFASIDAAFDQVIKRESIANNLDTTGEGKVLDARQGRELATRIENLSKEKIGTSDIVNDLETNNTQKPLSAAQGMILQAAIKNKISMEMRVVSLNPSQWDSNNEQIVQVSGVAADENLMAVLVEPASQSYDEYSSCKVRCSGQGSGTLTFKCKYKPTTSLTVDVLMLA